jgi:hypothetical protein
MDAEPAADLDAKHRSPSTERWTAGVSGRSVAYPIMTRQFATDAVQRGRTRALRYPSWVTLSGTIRIHAGSQT